MKGESSWREKGLATFAGIVVVFSAFPLLIILPVSFNPSPMLAMPSGGLSLKWYVEAATGSGFTRAFFFSFLIAGVSTFFSLIIGALAAWALTRYPFRGSSIVEAFFLSPLILARVVYGVAILIVFSRMGLGQSLVGLIIAHTVVIQPYVVRVVGSALIGVRETMEEAASILGANHRQILLHITFPLVRPGLVAAGVFSFISSLDEFTMTIFIVGPGVTTLPVQIFRHIELLVDPTVAAVSVIMILISAIVVYIVEWSVGLEKVLARV